MIVIIVDLDTRLPIKMSFIQNRANGDKLGISGLCDYSAVDPNMIYEARVPAYSEIKEDTDFSLIDPVTITHFVSVTWPGEGCLQTFRCALRSSLQRQEVVCLASALLIVMVNGWRTNLQVIAPGLGGFRCGRGGFWIGGKGRRRRWLGRP